MATDIKKQVNLEGFLQRHYGMTFNSKGFSKCPFCLDRKDHNPSFKVANGRWFDFHFPQGSKDFSGTVIDFVAKKEGLGFTEAMHKIIELERLEMRENIFQESDIVRTHDWHDENGKFLWQKIKLQDDTFRCRKKEGGRWSYNLNGIKHIPYRWNEIKDKEKVYLCEGERDADNLNALGYAATSAPFGKGNWPDELTAYFAGKEINIIYDVGNEQAACSVAAKLSKVTKRVYILNILLEETEADVTDYLDQFRDNETKRIKLLDLPGYEYDPTTDFNPIELETDCSQIKNPILTDSLSCNVEDYIANTQGWFTNQEIYQQLNITAANDKTRVRMILHRQKEKGLLEAHSKINGRFRKVAAELDIINWESADVTPVNLKWPFELEKYVNILPKSIIVIGGNKNSGKTTILLTLARLNMHKHKIFYFNSEMGDSQLKKRLMLFEKHYDDIKLKDFRKVTFAHLNQNIVHQIKPNDINILDYLENLIDFYNIGQVIADIHTRLDKGVAIIGMQKNPGKEHAIGGGFTEQKSQLYLTLDYGQNFKDGNACKIKSCKEWADPTNNPNGNIIHYKIIEGTKLITTDVWHFPDDDPHERQESTFNQRKNKWLEH